MKAIHISAIRLDKCNIIALTYRSLTDGFEWKKGFTISSGLFEVNFTSSTHSRIARHSAKYFQRLVRENGVLHPLQESTPTQELKTTTPFSPHCPTGRN